MVAQAGLASHWWQHAARRYALLILTALLTGCEQDPHNAGSLDVIWGRRGISDGRFQKPRAMAIDDQDRIYIVDMTARIQVFDAEGEFLHVWSTPSHDVGRPTGLSIDNDGNVLVADTHYYQVLIYSPAGKLLRSIGGEMGHEPGKFTLVTDAVQDREGYYYISEYGEYDRVQKFTKDGEFVLQWGGHGSELGEFQRPQNLAIDDQNRIWVIDAGNHRMQIFDTQGKLLTHWGKHGSGIGELSYPYDAVFDGHGHIYVCEYGNHRVQKFTMEGESLGCWGTSGRKPGQLFNPWALVRDRNGRIDVLDSNNHRVQRITM